MAPPPNHLIYTGKEGYKPLCHQADNLFFFIKFIKTELLVDLLEVADQLKINKISSTYFRKTKVHSPSPHIPGKKFDRQ